MKPELKIRARRGPLWVGPEHIELFGYQAQDESGLVAKKLEFVQEAERFAVIEPFLVIDPEQAQILMDDLWEAGVRPTEAKGSAGAMAAVQKHLGDMRRIAFHTLKIQGEQT